MFALRKFIPTDMDWGRSFLEGYALVILVCSTNNIELSISGADGRGLRKKYSSQEEGLAAFSSLKYIQSSLDLKIFPRKGEPLYSEWDWPEERLRADKVDYDSDNTEDTLDLSESYDYYEYYNFDFSFRNEIPWGEKEYL